MRIKLLMLQNIYSVWDVTGRITDENERETKKMGNKRCGINIPNNIL